MKRVLVSVKSVQRDMDGKDTVVELISPGTSHEKGNAQYGLLFAVKLPAVTTVV